MSGGLHTPRRSTPVKKSVPRDQARCVRRKGLKRTALVRLRTPSEKLIEKALVGPHTRSARTNLCQCFLARQAEPLSHVRDHSCTRPRYTHVAMHQHAPNSKPCINFRTNLWPVSQELGLSRIWQIIFVIDDPFVLSHVRFGNADNRLYVCRCQRLKLCRCPECAQIELMCALLEATVNQIKIGRELVHDMLLIARHRLERGLARLQRVLQRHYSESLAAKLFTHFATETRFTAPRIRAFSLHTCNRYKRHQVQRCTALVLLPRGHRHHRPSLI